VLHVDESVLQILLVLDEQLIVRDPRVLVQVIESGHVSGLLNLRFVKFLLGRVISVLGFTPQTRRPESERTLACAAMVVLKLIAVEGNRGPRLDLLAAKTGTRAAVDLLGGFVVALASACPCRVLVEGGECPLHIPIACVIGQNPQDMWLHRGIMEVIVGRCVARAI
jgi:hypothetical protein